MSVNASVLPLDGNARAIIEGLTSQQKWLPPRLFYDRAGSALFERITELPEYYLTATEQAIFERDAEDMVRSAGDCPTIVELGAGTAKKTMMVLRAAAEKSSALTFIPIDVSSSALEVARRRVKRELPQAAVHPLVMDYTERFPDLSRFAGPRLALYIGSSIGNFEPMEAAALLRRLRLSLRRGDALLLGTDMRKPASLLIPAYDDAEGVTAQFNLNVLARINREFAAGFELDRFAHRVVWNESESRIEMHLESLRPQRVHIGALDLAVDFAGGERIHTENSYKFTPKMIEALALNAGFRIQQTWRDDRNWFRVTLLRA
jgi:dimethylhistidine N-methyltransferase